MITAVVLKFFSSHRYGNIKAKIKTKTRNSKSTEKRDLLRTRDLFHDVLTLAGYVEVLVIPTGARRIKVVEEKPAHSYLGNLGYRHRAHPRTSQLPALGVQLWRGCQSVSSYVCGFAKKHLLSYQVEVSFKDSPGAKAIWLSVCLGGVWIASIC